MKPVDPAVGRSVDEVVQLNENRSVSWLDEMLVSVVSITQMVTHLNILIDQSGELGEPSSETHLCDLVLGVIGGCPPSWNETLKHSDSEGTIPLDGKIGCGDIGLDGFKNTNNLLFVHLLNLDLVLRHDAESNNIMWIWQANKKLDTRLNHTLLSQLAKLLVRRQSRGSITSVVEDDFAVDAALVPGDFDFFVVDGGGVNLGFLVEFEGVEDPWGAREDGDLEEDEGGADAALAIGDSGEGGELGGEGGEDFGVCEEGN